MLVQRTLSLAARPRCFGCRAPGAWACPACTADLSAPDLQTGIDGLDQSFIPWAYQGIARDLILALKLRGARPAAGPLATAVARTIHVRGTGAMVITWVPGRRRDVRARGFDHAALVARELGQRLGLPVVAALRRTGPRPDQTTLSGPARRASPTGAFAATKRLGMVMLVDDLVTTGATARACAGALREGGATRVELAAPCRA